MKNHWVMDYETFINCFIAVFEHYQTEKRYVFVISPFRNDLSKLLKFLRINKIKGERHISFNGLAFDAQLTEYIIRNRNMLLKSTAEKVAGKIYLVSQDCIERSNNRQFQKWSEQKLNIKQIDLFKLNHWDNPAKRSSLKSIQVAIRWHNVQDMPMDHTEPITTLEQQNVVVKYCINDVASTKQVMVLCKDQISLRGTLTKTYNIPLFSASEPRISKELFLMFLSEKMEADPRELKKLRTWRTSINFEDIILPWINFDELPLFENMLKQFKAVSLDPDNTRGGFKTSVKYRGLKSDFGLGGVHGARKGVFIANEGMTIMSSDVVSFYPRQAMVNQWSPEQLPKKAFTEQYQWFFDERRKIPKKDPRNYVYKIVLNSTYGLSNDKNCFLYDPEFTMRITVNGQLQLTMLYTMLCERVKGAFPLMQNTDGVEIMIPETEKDNYLAVCKEWEELTKLELEHDEYQKLFIPDVNSYIGVFKFKEVDKDKYENLKESNPEDPLKEENGKFYHAKTKRKGRLEFKDLALHKNHSFLVIKKALYYYFVHDIMPEDYLKSNRDIFDYCGAVKARGDWKFVENRLDSAVYNEQAPIAEKIRWITGHGFYMIGRNLWRTSDMEGEMAGATTEQAYKIAIQKAGGQYSEKDLQKTVRYYISKKGGKLMKHNKLDGRVQQVEAGKWLQTVYNVHEEKSWEEYDINDKYYLDKIYKEIKNLVPERFNNQISLF